MREVRLLVEPEPDDPGCALILVDGSVAGRPYRFVLDTGSARSQLVADEYTDGLSPEAADSSFGAFGTSLPGPLVAVTDLS